MLTLAQVGRTLVAGIFVLGALAKAADYRNQAVTFYLPWALAVPYRRILFAFIIAGELVLALLILFPPSTRWVALAVVVICSALALYGRRSISATGTCGCFGAPEPEGRQDARSFLARNLIVATGGATAVLLGPDDTLAWMQQTQSTLFAVLAALLPWGGIVVVSALTVLLERSSRGQVILRDVRWWLASQRS